MNSQRPSLPSRSSWPRLRASLSLLSLLSVFSCKKSEPEADAKVQVSAARIAELTQAAALEKTDLKLGFIKLTDCAPLIVAKELGYFKDEGLNVTVEAQANWKVVLDRIISGELDGAHMLASQPIAAAAGIGVKAEILAPYVLESNGNGITVSNAIWAEMQKAEPALKEPQPKHPISASALQPYALAQAKKGTPLKFSMTFPYSTHNYELRYWLAAGGIHPGLYSAQTTTGTEQADALLSVTPPPQMPATLEAGTTSGYCVGEPWNEQAVMKGIGVVVASSDEVIKGRPEKVFGLTKAFTEKHPKTSIALVKALIRAGKWLDESMENRKLAVKMLAKKEHVGADEAVLINSMTGTFLYQKDDRREKPGFNVFYANYSSYPFYSDAVWYLTQMRRWGQVSEPKPDAWYHEVAKAVYVPTIYQQATEALLAEKKLTESSVPPDSDGYRKPNSETIDGVVFDGKRPLEYLKAMKIGYTE